MLPLSRAIGTRVHHTCARGPFTVHTVESQGRAPLHTFHAGVDLQVSPSPLLAIALADVCGHVGRRPAPHIGNSSDDNDDNVGCCNGDMAGGNGDEASCAFESLARTIAEAALDGADEPTLERLLADHPYAAVTLTMLTCERDGDDKDADDGGGETYTVTLWQVGCAVDVWCLGRCRDDDDDDICNGDGEYVAGATGASGVDTIRQWSSRETSFADVPLTVAVDCATDGSSGGGGGGARRVRRAAAMQRLVHLPVRAALGARAFAHVERDVRITRHRVRAGDRIVVHSNGFEPSAHRAQPVADWLPWRLHRAHAHDEQFDGDWREVLDDECARTAETARNRFIAIVQLRDAAGSRVGGRHGGVCSDGTSAATRDALVHSSALRAGRYVPGGDRRYERALERHCARLGASKVQMIALYNEQCGAMAAAHADETLRALCATTSPPSSSSSSSRSSSSGSDESDDDDSDAWPTALRRRAAAVRRGTGERDDGGGGGDDSDENDWSAGDCYDWSHKPVLHDE